MHHDCLSGGPGSLALCMDLSDDSLHADMPKGNILEVLRITRWCWTRQVPIDLVGCRCSWPFLAWPLCLWVMVLELYNVLMSVWQDLHMSPQIAPPACAKLCSFLY